MPTFTIGNRNFSSEQMLGPFTVPQKLANEDFVSIQLTSGNWNSQAGRRLIVTIEQSFDDGANWQAFSSDTFTKGAVAKDGSLPSIILAFDDGLGRAPGRQFRVRISAPDGTVNAGFVATF